MSVKPIKLMGEQLNISKDLVIIDEAKVTSDEDDTKDRSEDGEDEGQPHPSALIKRLMMESSISALPCSSEGLRRKRGAEPQSTKLIPAKIRKRGRGVAIPGPGSIITSMNQAGILVSSAPENSADLTPTGGRARGTGRGRGRPRGSTNKAKWEEAERELLDQEMKARGEEVNEVKVKDEEEVKPGVGVEKESETEPQQSADVKGDEPVVDTTTSPEPLPLGGDPEETRMSSSDVKPAISDMIISLATPILVDEESQESNVSSTSLSTAANSKRFTKEPIEGRRPVTAETLYEYQWPQNDKNAEFFFLQEQISEYLGVSSFKRKYPDIRRRIVDMEERDFLRDFKVVSETQFDLGLTAVHSCDVLDIMFNDFSEKYEEYRKVFQEKARISPQTGTETAAVPDRSAEFMQKILKSCAKWNFDNNRVRMKERPCSFDLQTGTLHYPKDKIKVLPPEATKLGKYPVAVLPTQFTDYYRKYTPDELSYLPLNTVINGPIWEEKFDFTCAPGSEFESDESSSDDSSSSSSDEEGDSVVDSELNPIVVLTDDSGKEIYRAPSGLTKVSTDGKCKSCDGTVNKNKDGNSEVLLHCSRCNAENHPTCLELTIDMLPFITKYLWECTECKSCLQCNDQANEDKMLFCDCCDRGYHIYCVGLRKIPRGRWHCSECAVCYSCGVTQPSPEERTAEWHHEFRKGEKGAKFYLHSLCVPCHLQYRKGLFCPSCLKVHEKFDKDILMECGKCEKWVHKACVKRRAEKSIFGFMCDPCDANFWKQISLPAQR